MLTPHTHYRLQETIVMFLIFKHTCAQNFIAAPFMRASDAFKPPQLSFQQRSHHYEYWVPQLVGRQSQGQDTLSWLKNNFSWWSSIKSEANNCFNHALLQSATAGVMSFREVASKLSKNKQHREKYSKVSTNTAKWQQKLQCIRLRLRRDDKSAKQTSSWTNKKKNLGCGSSSPVKIMAIISSTKDKRWLTKDQQHIFFSPMTDLGRFRTTLSPFFGQTIDKKIKKKTQTHTHWLK